LFFSSGILDFLTAVREGRIALPQVFAVFLAQSSSTYDNKDELNNEPSTSEMSRAETPHTYHNKNRNFNGRFAKASDDSTINSHGTNFDKHFQIDTSNS
jgi:hypothetical protein